MWFILVMVQALKWPGSFSCYHCSMLLNVERKWHCGRIRMVNRVICHIKKRQFGMGYNIPLCFILFLRADRRVCYFALVSMCLCAYEAIPKELNILIRCESFNTELLQRCFTEDTPETSGWGNGLLPLWCVFVWRNKCSSHNFYCIPMALVV